MEASPHCHSLCLCGRAPSYESNSQIHIRKDYLHPRLSAFSMLKTKVPCAHAFAAQRGRVHAGTKNLILSRACVCERILNGHCWPKMYELKSASPKPQKENPWRADLQSYAANHNDRSHRSRVTPQDAISPQNTLSRGGGRVNPKICPAS